MAFDELNKKSAEGMQADYLIKEQRAVQDLHKLQTALANQLYATRLALQTKLSEEARKSGQAVEDYLAEYGLTQRLDAISNETKARQASVVGNNKTLQGIQKQNQNRLIAAEKTLAKLSSENAKKLAAAKQKSALALQKIESAAMAEANKTAVTAEDDVTDARLTGLAQAAQERAKLAKEELAAIAAATEARQAGATTTDGTDLAGELEAIAQRGEQTEAIDSVHAAAIIEAEVEADKIRKQSFAEVSTILEDQIKKAESAAKLLADTMSAASNSAANGSAGDSSAATVEVNADSALSVLDTIEGRILSLAETIANVFAETTQSVTALFDTSAADIKTAFVTMAAQLKTDLTDALPVAESATMAGNLAEAGKNVEATKQSAENLGTTVTGVAESVKEAATESDNLKQAAESVAETESEIKKDTEASAKAQATTATSAAEQAKSQVESLRLRLQATKEQSNLTSFLQTALSLEEERRKLDVQSEAGRQKRLKEIQFQIDSLKLEGDLEEQLKAANEQVAAIKAKGAAASVEELETAQAEVERLNDLKIEYDGYVAEKTALEARHNTAIQKALNIYAAEQAKRTEEAAKQGIEAEAASIAKRMDLLRGYGASAAEAAAATSEENYNNYIQQIKLQNQLAAEEAKARLASSEEFKSLTEEEQNLRLAGIDKEYEAKSQKEEKHAAYIKKQSDKLEKSDKSKEKTAQRQEAADAAAAPFKTDKTGLAGLKAILKPDETAVAESRQKLMDKAKEMNPGMSDEDAAAYAARSQKMAQITAAMGKAADLIASAMKDADEIGKAALKVNTQLQGTNNTWNKLNDTIGKGVGISMNVRQKSVVDAAKTLVDKGITHNLEQRAFLEAIKEGVAGTFDAADGALLKLVRIQQADSTAARLGMESALTSFLNSMYETSEYMVEAARSVRQSLYEASALMEAEDAVELEYQVQKWMGSLYSAGFSKSEDLATALGKYMAGDLEGLTDGGMGSLLLMATERAGLSVAEILEKGMNNESTNVLLEAVVSYLSEIYEETHGSNVLAQQFAGVYGLTASDLKAASNLSGTLKTISSNTLSAGEMLGQLQTMMESYGKRVSAAEQMATLKDNMSYSLSEGFANSKISFILNEVGQLLENYAGGLFNLPFINVYGFGLDLNASAAELMQLAAMVSPVMSLMGDAISGLASGGTSGMLQAFGITDGISKINARGMAPSKTKMQKGATVSESGYVGNESSSDVQDKTMQDASEDGEKEIAQAKEENEDIKLKQVDEHVVQIYDLLESITTGSRTFHVQVDGMVSGLGNAWM